VLGPEYCFWREKDSYFSRIIQTANPLFRADIPGFFHTKLVFCGRDGRGCQAMRANYQVCAKKSAVWQLRALPAHVDTRIELAQLYFQNMCIQNPLYISGGHVVFVRHSKAGLVVATQPSCDNVKFCQGRRDV